MILLPFFILAIALSVLRSFCLSLFWPLHCLFFDLFAFLYFDHCRSTDNTNVQEEFEDTKGVIRIRKSKENRQHNGQKKTDKQQ
jgi:hypothetical protein